MVANKENIKLLVQQVINLTVPCSDDGVKFVQSDRIHEITAKFANSQYALLGKSSLAYVYRHNEYQPEMPTILVSSHIDSLYRKYFARETNDKIRGTLDNSACNAVVVELMKQRNLPCQVLVAFTGNEERECAGAVQVIDILKQHKPAFRSLELVISLDLTGKTYERNHFTVENYFVKQQHNDAFLKFSRRDDIKEYLRRLRINNPTFIEDAEPDESCKYKEYMNCFTLCLPCKVLGNDMHKDTGVAVRTESLGQYARALSEVTFGIADDLWRRGGSSKRHIRRR